MHEGFAQVGRNEKRGVQLVRSFNVDRMTTGGLFLGVVDTREQILEAAWNLFAERGFEDVSVRDVTNSAGVNLASVSYHFGGKEGLIQETVKRCMNPINEYRIKLLEQEIAKHGGLGSVPIHDLMTAFMRPVVMPEECGVRAGLMLRLVARYLIESDYTIPSVSRNLYTEVFQIYAKAFMVHYPDLSALQIVKHIVFASGTVIYYHGLGKVALQLSSGIQGDVGEIDRDEMLLDIVEFSIHGFGGKSRGPDS
ncbi:MAG: TetR/AcrR family transcriptional regulator [Akkermansiaceae bacterium]|jgi:AcrR family transcriptional regulator|tara:strand:- start:8967 stop:9722 length:756 start_codon:yes stop_codon:yes gene_type:complete